MSGTEGKSAAADAVKQVRAVAGSVVDDVAAGRWRRVGLVGVSLGVVAVGAAAGIAAERLTLGREMRRRAEAEVEAAAPFGSLRGIARTVTAPDGTELYVELDGTGWAGSPLLLAPAASPAVSASAPAASGSVAAAPDRAAPQAADAAATGLGAASRPVAASGGSSRARSGARGGAGVSAGDVTDGPGAPPASGGSRSRKGARAAAVTDGSVTVPASVGGPVQAQAAAGTAAQALSAGAGTANPPAASSGASARPARKGWLARFRAAAAGQPQAEGPLGGVLAGKGSRLGMAPAPPLTVVFCHGYCLNQDCWHFQRAAFRDGLRLVFWDQRSHGRSERSRSHLTGVPASIDQLGGDLKAVLDAVAPTGPLVLVGHSMGGMTVMALADQHPELFRDRVAAVALIGTTAGSWSGVTLGLPAYGAKMLHRVAPGVLKALGRQRDLVERSRRMGSDLTSVLYRKFSFGTEDLDPAVERFAQRLLEATPIDVVAEFFPAFDLHEKTMALSAFRNLPTLVLGGTRDLLTPPNHSEAIAAELPDADLVIVQDAGHLVMLERPDLVNARLALLLEQAAEASGALLPESVRDLARDAALSQ